MKHYLNDDGSKYRIYPNASPGQLVENPYWLINKNEMTDITSNVTTVGGWAGGTPYVVGKAYGTVYAYRWAGLDAEGEPQIYNENGEKVLRTTGVQSTDALVAVGTRNPKQTVGFTNMFQYKGWGLSCMFVYNGGHIFKKDTPTIGGRITTNYNRLLNDRWKVPGDEARTDIPKFDSAPDNVDRANVYNSCEQHWVKGDYIKLRDLELSYDLQKPLLDKFGIRNTVLKLQVRNLFYWAKNKGGLDPEIFNLGGTRSPLAPTYSFGLSITL